MAARDEGAAKWFELLSAPHAPVANARAAWNKCLAEDMQAGRITREEHDALFMKERDPRMYNWQRDGIGTAYQRYAMRVLISRRSDIFTDETVEAIDTLIDCLPDKPLRRKRVNG